MSIIMMEQTFNILPQETKKVLIETGEVKELECGIKYLKLKDND